MALDPNLEDLVQICDTWQSSVMPIDSGSSHVSRLERGHALHSQVIPVEWCTIEGNV